MFSITRDDLKKYELVGFGKYGKVYRINSDTVIKVYKDKIKGMVGEAMFNPALQVSKRRLRRITKRAKQVENTDLARDIVVLDGYFHGFVLPYYEGSTLDKSKDLPYEEKKDISKKLVSNDQELKRNCIYPLDYHTDNIMVVDGKVKIIDLDDPLTHFTILPNLALSKLSMGRLNETIQDFYDEFDLSLYGCYTMARLERVRPQYSSSKDWLEKYLEEKEEVKDYLIIDKETDIEVLKELLRNHRFRVLYSLEEVNSDETVRILEKFREQEIEIYDFLLENKQDRYFSNYPVKNKVLVKKDASVIH